MQINLNWSKSGDYLTLSGGDIRVSVYGNRCDAKTQALLRFCETLALKNYKPLLYKNKERAGKEFKSHSYVRVTGAAGTVDVPVKVEELRIDGLCYDAFFDNENEKTKIDAVSLHLEDLRQAYEIFYALGLELKIQGDVLSINQPARFGGRPKKESQKV